MSLILINGHYYWVVYDNSGNIVQKFGADPIPPSTTPQPAPSH